jgi:hypothetical protein
MSTAVERDLSMNNGRSADDATDVDLPFRLSLELSIDDREVIRALVDHPEGDARNEFAVEAMKIGVLALRHVGGQVNADLIRRENDRLVAGVQKTFDQYTMSFQDRVENKLKEYFDPKDGRFTDRVQRLVAHDGELSLLIKSFIDGENSLFARTLVTHVGRDSALMKVLDPQQSDGLLTTLRKNVEDQLTHQRDHLLKEFSLDNKEGALARLLVELTTNHGDVGKALQTKIDAMCKDFSFDEENSALSRLMRNVTQAQRTITSEFSLDNETSCLSKLKREMMTVLEAHVKTNAEFQEEVKLALQKLTTTREVEAGTPRHGIKFEDAVLQLVTRQANDLGDVAEHTGAKTGQLKGRVVGDIVVELGPESAAPQGKVVFEAKERENYSLDKARAEIELARKNRQAQIGVFVYSKKTAPSHLRSISRIGCDIFVTWDADDPSTDIHLSSAFDIARALCVRQSHLSESATADFSAIDKSINDVEKRADNLDEVQTFAETIHSSSEKILDRVRIDREALKKQVAFLREKVKDLRDITSSTS